MTTLTNSTPILSLFPRASSSEETVIDLTKHLIEVTNKRIYDNPAFETLMSPSFHGKIEGNSTSGIRDHVDRHKFICSFSPNYDMEVVDSMAKVDEQRGRAKVWVNLKMTHFQGEVERSSINVFTWMRLGGKWTCYQHQALRGIREFE